VRAARAIKCRDVSCCEMMQAYLKHIDWLNPIVHALRLGVEQAALIALAHHRDTQLRPGEYLGWMHGLPTVIREKARRMKNAACIIVSEANQSRSVSDCDCEYRPVARLPCRSMRMINEDCSGRRRERCSCSGLENAAGRRRQRSRRVPAECVRFQQCPRFSPVCGQSAS